MRLKIILSFTLLLMSINLFAQSGTIKGIVMHEFDPIKNVRVNIEQLKLSVITDSIGQFQFNDLPYGQYSISVMDKAYIVYYQSVSLDQQQVELIIPLEKKISQIDEIVITGTLQEVKKSDSPIPIEVYSAKFFLNTPNTCLFDALQTINGVRPQVNCNICSTGDIHINGLEGPYTMVLIDGMPIVSGLSTVYGLSGIPSALIERVEIVKGPAATLYGSEAVGGLINVITKTPQKAPLISFSNFITSWGEYNADLGVKFKVGKKVSSLLGLDYFGYNTPIDRNQDGFTDATLQQRISVFNKWNFQRKEGRQFSLAARYVNENRWGGQVNWTPAFCGSDSIYAESIYTQRWEIFGNYQLPLKEKIVLSFSTNQHQQDSYYGTMPYKANQNIAFSQLTWNKTIGRQSLLAGIAYRFTYFDDNTMATQQYLADSSLQNAPSVQHLPGIFIQDELAIGTQHTLLAGIRYDYNSIHKSIFTPRLNYKWNSKNKATVLRLGIGNGYRVANIFTEDHAALTGARTLVIKNQLKPETSWNANINGVYQQQLSKGGTIDYDASIFYTYFTNKIIPDYTTNANQIIYDNLSGHSVSQGISLTINYRSNIGIQALIGATLMDVHSKDNNLKERQLLTERFSATWNISYTVPTWKLRIDYTGNVYSPMKLPTLGEADPRPTQSPWFSIQNIQFTQPLKQGFEIFVGAKNFLNWTPTKKIPFLIARSHDPFDKNVIFDAQGNAQKTVENPYGLTFDPSYVYASNQGIRIFLGFRYILK